MHNGWLLSVKVTRSSTIEVRRVVYTVPSRLIGERAQVRLYHDHLALYVGQQLAQTLPRVYPKASQNRARSINYHHVIRSLVAKPHAFRYSQIRDDLLPSNIYRQLRPGKIVDVEQRYVRNDSPHQRDRHFPTGEEPVPCNEATPTSTPLRGTGSYLDAQRLKVPVPLHPQKCRSLSYPTFHTPPFIPPFPTKHTQKQLSVPLCMLIYAPFPKHTKTPNRPA